MAVLINGNGNEAIYAQQDADWFASIMGNQTAITAIGSKFAATLEDANTIGVADGVIITQEGRRIQLDANELDLFDIPAGGQGETNYYIIGYHLVTGDLSEQYCETFVRLMDNDTDTIPEDTFRGGADEVFVSLYRVTQVNLAITDMELLLPEITTVAQISQRLNELERRGAMPILDYDNPLHNFSTDGLTYTTTKECYVTGTIITNSLDTRRFYINNKPVAVQMWSGYAYGSSGMAGSMRIEPLKLQAGLNLKVDLATPLYVLEEI